MHPDTRAGGLAVDPFRWYAALIGVWCGVWLLHEHSVAAHWSPWADVFFWTAIKIVVWLMPLLVLARRAGTPWPDFLSLRRPVAGFRVGVMLGVAFVVAVALVDALTKTWRWPALGPGTLNALIVAPVFEEVVFRGYALRALQGRGRPFATANVLAAVLFLGLHLPGWYFMGGIRTNLLASGAGILLVGIVAGYAKRRADSTWAAVTVHFLNNAYSVFVI